MEQDFLHSSLFKLDSSPSGFIWSYSLKIFHIYWFSKSPDDSWGEVSSRRVTTLSCSPTSADAYFLNVMAKTFLHLYPPSRHQKFYLELRQVHRRWCTAPTHLKLCSTFQVSGWDKVSGSSEMYSIFSLGLNRSERKKKL